MGLGGWWEEESGVMFSDFLGILFRQFLGFEPANFSQDTLKGNKTWG